MAKFVINYYDTKEKKAHSFRTCAKTEDIAITLFVDNLARNLPDVGGFCFFNADYARAWLEEWVPHYVGINVYEGEDRFARVG